MSMNPSGWGLNMASEETRKRFIAPDHLPRAVLPPQPRRPPEGIPHKLKYRAVNGGYPYPSRFAFHDPHVSTSKFYINIVPNFTCQDLVKPFCHLRKFTFDGQHLLGINRARTNLVVYRYKGLQAATQMLQCLDYRQEEVHEYDATTEVVQRQLFDTIFKERHSITIADNGFEVHKDFSVFLDDNVHVIMLTSKFVDNDHPLHYLMNRSNEILDGGFRPKEHYTLVMVNFIEGRVVDKYVIKNDRIASKHQECASLHGRTFVLFSKQQQTIFVFNISPSNKFIRLREIGRFLLEDDQFMVEQRHPELALLPAFSDTLYTGLKQRVLACLYRMVARSEATKEPNCLNMSITYFYHVFQSLEALRMRRVQLLDDKHLLIKLETDPAARYEIWYKVFELYIVYNHESTVIVDLFPRDSPQLLATFEKYANWSKVSSSASSSGGRNYHEREARERFKTIEALSRNDNPAEANKLALESPLFNCQAISYSPYLDKTLFIFDEEALNPSDQMRPNPEHPIRFHYRSNDHVAFRWHTQQHLIRGDGLTPPQMISFIHHPTEPFAISIMRNIGQHCLNFHLRHFNPKVEVQDEQDDEQALVPLAEPDAERLS